MTTLKRWRVSLSLNKKYSNCFHLLWLNLHLYVVPIRIYNVQNVIKIGYHVLMRLDIF
jgi:hypothetical protein